MVNLRGRIVEVLPTIPQPFTPSRIIALLNLPATSSARKAVRYHLDRLEAEGIIQLSHRGSRGEKYYLLTPRRTHTPHIMSIPASSLTTGDGLSMTPRTHPADSITLNAARLDALAITTLLEEAVSSAHDAILLTNLTSRHLTQTFYTLIDLHPQHVFTIHITPQTYLTDDQLNSLARRKHVHLLVSQPRTPTSAFMNLLLRIIRNLQKTAGSLSIHTPPHPLAYPGKYGLYPAIQDDTLTITTHGAILIDYPRLARQPYQNMRRSILSSLRSLFTHTFRSTLTTPLSVKRIIHLIRFWNYGIKEDRADAESIAAFLTSMNQQLREFAHAEEIILKSSGMPLTYETHLSVLFDQAKPDSFTQRKFHPIRIRSLRQLIEDETIRTRLREKERVTHIFTGGDRTRIFHTTPTDPEEILEEIRFLTSSYDFPLLTIDFTTPYAHTSLTTYFTPQAKMEKR